MQRAAKAAAAEAITATAKAKKNHRNNRRGIRPQLWDRLVAATTAIIVLARLGHMGSKLSDREAEIFQEAMLTAVRDYSRPQDTVFFRVQV